MGFRVDEFSGMPLRWSDWRDPANLVTLARGAVGLLFLAGAVAGSSGAPAFLPERAFQLLLAAGIASDKLDGLIARKTKRRTGLGGVLEMTVDGTFILSSAAYEILYFSFPLLPVWTGLLFLTAALAIAAGVRIVYDRWFKGPFISVKLAPAFSYLMLFVFAFRLPGQRWFEFAAVLVAAIAFGDFLYRLRGFLNQSIYRTAER